MGRAGVITDVIDVKRTTAQVTTLLAQLKQIDDAIAKSAVSVASAGSGVKGSTGLAGQKKAQEELNATQKEAMRLMREYETIEAKITIGQEKLARRTAELKQQKDAISAKIKEEINLNAKMVGEYKALETLVKKLGDAYKNVAAAQGINSKAALEAKSAFEKQNKSLLDINHSMGNMKDRVGQYERALSGLQGPLGNVHNIYQSFKTTINETSQAHGGFNKATILGAAAIGGIVAAGVGLIAFFKKAGEMAMGWERDQRRLFHALDDNTEAFERTMRLKDQLMKTTLFSDEDINSAITMGLEMNKSEAEIKKMVETALGLSKISGDPTSNMLKLSQAIEGNVEKLGKYIPGWKEMTDEQRKTVNVLDVLHDRFSKLGTEGLDTTEGKLKNAKKYWGEFMKSAGEGVLGFIDIMSTGLSYMTKVVNAIDNLVSKDKKAPTVDPGIQTMMDQAVRNQQEREAKTAKGNSYYSDPKKVQEDTEAILKSMKENADATKTFAKTKEQAEKEFYDFRVKYGIASLDEQRDHEVSEFQKMTEFKKLTAKEQGEQINAIHAKYIALQIADEEDKVKKIKAANDNIIAAQDAERKEKGAGIDKGKSASLTSVVSMAGMDKENELTSLQSLYSKKLILTEEYKRREKEINEKYDQIILEKSIEVIQKTIASQKEAGIDTEASEKELSGIQIKLAELVYLRKKEKIEQNVEDEKEYNIKKKELYQEIYDGLKNLMDALYASSIQNLDDEKSRVDERYEKEYNAAEGNSKKQKEIKKRQAKEDAEIDKQKKKMLHDQAVIGKAIAAVEIVIKTAVGAVAQFQSGSGGIVLAALVIAAGAVALATVLAQPIPSYRKGRKGGKAEIARVSEEGSEGLLTKEGKMFLTPEQETLAYIPQGATIIPHHELVDMVGKSSITGLPRWEGENFTDMGLLIAQNERMERSIVSAVKNKRELHLNIDQHGFRVAASYGAVWEHYLNERIRL